MVFRLPALHIRYARQVTSVMNTKGSVDRFYGSEGVELEKDQLSQDFDIRRGPSVATIYRLLTFIH
jgi:hypothetical protein